MESEQNKKVRTKCLSQQHWLSDPGGAPDACLNTAGTTAFRYHKNVGFVCSLPQTVLRTTITKISGLNDAACNLAPSGFGLPLPGLPADFTTDLVANL